MKFSVVYIIGLLCCLVNTVSGQVVITEVQPVPAAGEPEWIELENLSNRAVSICGWQVCDSRSCVVVNATAATAGCTIAAHGRLIVTRNIEDLLESRSFVTVPVIEVALPSLNNSTETIVLRNRDSMVIDSMAYSMKAHVRGRTIERTGVADANVVVYDSTWLTCLAADSATCGTLNSVIHLPHDLRSAELNVGDSSVTVVVSNHGIQAMPSCKVSMTLRCAGKMRTVSTQLPALLRGEVYEWHHSIAVLGWPIWQGVVDIEVVVDIVDDRASNDTLRTTIVLPPPPASVALNEIMYEANDGYRDYAEVYNNSDTAISITGWTLEDASGVRCVISTISTIPPRGYAVITGAAEQTISADSGVIAICKPAPDWNVSGDAVVLRSSAGFVVDACTYSPEWHTEGIPVTKGISLEKINVLLPSAQASSWTSSASLRGGTPGASNSVNQDVEGGFGLSATPSPFSTRRLDLRHPAILSWKMPFQHSTVSLRIVTPDGRPIRQLLNGEMVGHEGYVAWDGTNDGMATVTPGPYVALVECVDLASTKTYAARCVVVVGE